LVAEAEKDVVADLRLSVPVPNPKQVQLVAQQTLGLQLGDVGSNDFVGGFDGGFQIIRRQVRVTVGRF
jgi:hypothetical protein